MEPRGEEMHGGLSDMFTPRPWKESRGELSLRYLLIGMKEGRISKTTEEEWRDALCIYEVH